MGVRCLAGSLSKCVATAGGPTRLEGALQAAEECRLLDARGEAREVHAAVAQREYEAIELCRLAPDGDRAALAPIGLCLATDTSADPRQNLDAVSAPIEEHKEMPAHRVRADHAARERR